MYDDDQAPDSVEQDSYEIDDDDKEKDDMRKEIENLRSSIHVMRRSMDRTTEREQTIRKTQKDVTKNIRCSKCLQVPRTVDDVAEVRIIEGAVCYRCMNCSKLPRGKAPRLSPSERSSLQLLIRSIEHECRFHNSGCIFKDFIPFLLSHEEECLYRDVTCPGCKRLVPYLNFRRHLETPGSCSKRAWNIEKASKFSFPVPSKFDPGERKNFMSVIEFDDHLFIPYITCKRGDDFSIAIQMNGNETECKGKILISNVY